MVGDQQLISALQAAQATTFETALNEKLAAKGGQKAALLASLNFVEWTNTCQLADSQALDAAKIKILFEFFEDTTPSPFTLIKFIKDSPQTAARAIIDAAHAMREHKQHRQAQYLEYVIRFLTRDVEVDALDIANFLRSIIDNNAAPYDWIAEKNPAGAVKNYSYIKEVIVHLFHKAGLLESVTPSKTLNAQLKTLLATLTGETNDAEAREHLATGLVLFLQALTSADIKYTHVNAQARLSLQPYTQFEPKYLKLLDGLPKLDITFKQYPRVRLVRRASALRASVANISGFYTAKAVMQIVQHTWKLAEGAQTVLSQPYPVNASSTGKQECFVSIPGVLTQNFSSESMTISPDDCYLKQALKELHAQWQDNRDVKMGKILLPTFLTGFLRIVEIIIEHKANAIEAKVMMHQPGQQAKMSDDTFELFKAQLLVYIGQHYPNTIIAVENTQSHLVAPGVSAANNSQAQSHATVAVACLLSRAEGGDFADIDTTPAGEAALLEEHRNAYSDRDAAKAYRAHIQKLA